MGESMRSLLQSEGVPGVMAGEDLHREYLLGNFITKEEAEKLIPRAVDRAKETFYFRCEDFARHENIDLLHMVQYCSEDLWPIDYSPLYLDIRGFTFERSGKPNKLTHVGLYTQKDFVFPLQGTTGFSTVQAEFPQIDEWLERMVRENTYLISLSSR